MKGKKTIDQRLAELDDLRAELLDKRASMTEREKVEALEAAQPKVERGTPEMDALLASGYEMSASDAERIIKERDADPHTWPFEQYQKAKAFLAAFHATNIAPSSDKRGWHRSRA